MPTVSFANGFGHAKKGFILMIKGESRMQLMAGNANLPLAERISEVY